MEFYILPSLKSKTLNHAYKKLNCNGPMAEKIKNFFKVEILIENDITFQYQNIPHMMINEQNLKKMNNMVKEILGDKTIYDVAKNAATIEAEDAKPIHFSTLNEFINHKKGNNNSNLEELRLKNFLRKKSKINAAEVKNKKRSVSYNKLFNDITKDTRFLSLDFECSFQDIKVVLEAGASTFSLSNSKCHHWLIKENLHEYETQPKKFNKGEEFSFGKTTLETLQSIKEKLQNMVNESDYIVCHAAQLEKNILRALGVSFDSEKVIDSQILYKTLENDKNVLSLEKIIDKMLPDYKTVTFHNAGNDAALTKDYFLEIIKNKRPELIETKEKTQKKSLKNKL